MKLPIWIWLTAPDNAPTVGALGLIVSLFGFAITIWQLVRTRNALVAANDATSALRSKLAGQNAAIHATNAMSHLKESQRLVRADEWLVALEELESLRGIILILHNRPDHVGAHFRAESPSILKDLSDYVGYVEKRHSSGIAHSKKMQILKRLRELSTMLTSVSDELTEKIR